MKVLVVDDSQIALYDLISKLSEIIAEEDIFPASGYDEAVELLNQQHIDMAFVDLQMPGKTGMDLIIDYLSKNDKTKDIPVVVTTGVEPNSLITHSLQQTTYRYLFKPISIDQLKEAIGNIPVRKS